MENNLNLMLGTIKGSEIRQNRDSNINSRMLNSEISSPEDIQSVELIIPHGQDFNPEIDNVVLILEISPSYKLGILIDDGSVPDATLQEGEKELFSIQNGVKKAKIRLNKDGEIILNDGNNFAVKFNELKAQFDQFKIEFAGHLHTGVTPGGGNSGVPSAALTLDLSSAKAEKVRL